MKNVLTGLSTIALTIGLVASAQATVIGGMVTSGGGMFVKETTPLSSSNPANTVGNDNYDNLNLYAFDESQNIVIPGTIQVDVGTNPQMGDLVASHYVFFDPPGNQLPLNAQMGYVDFDADIFGVATSTANLAASDFLANTTVTYLNPGLRGLEGGDSVTIDPMNPRRLLVDWAAGTPGDYVRVFTERSPLAVPEPATLGLLGLGVLGLGLAGRRARK